MDDVGYERLFTLFAWEHRETTYRVRFHDGDEYYLTRIIAGQDPGEPPHASASVTRTLQRRGGGVWPADNAMFFHFPDIAEVADVATGEIYFRAV